MVELARSTIHTLKLKEDIQIQCLVPKSVLGHINVHFMNLGIKVNKQQNCRIFLQTFNNWFAENLETYLLKVHFFINTFKALSEGTSII